jgi:hypothetical protein
LAFCYSNNALSFEHAQAGQSHHHATTFILDK